MSSKWLQERCRGSKNEVEIPSNGLAWVSKVAGAAKAATFEYRGTSHTRERTPLGPYHGPMHRVLGGGVFSYGPSGTGVPRSSENATPWDPTVGSCLGPYGGPRGVAFAYERDAPTVLCISLLVLKQGLWYN